MYAGRAGIELSVLLTLPKQFGIKHTLPFAFESCIYIIGICTTFGVNLYALLLRLKRLSHKSFRLSFQLRFNTYITITQICDSFSEL